MIRALIIEDEPHAQRELMRLLEDAPFELEVLGVADSVEDGAELIQSHSSADLIFMDIQLSDGLSFDIFEKVEITTPVIFTTAFDEYAIRAFKVNSVDYLLKPVVPEDLSSALQKFEQNRMPSVPVEAIMKAFAQSEQPIYKSRWISKVGDKLKTYSTEEVAYFYADDDSLYLVPVQGSPVIIDGTLSQLVEKLDPKRYFQISRKVIVTYSSLDQVEKYGASQFSVELKPQFEERVLVSRSRTKEFLDWLNQ